MQECYTFLNVSEPYDPLTYRFFLYYRVRQRSGKYVRVKDEKLAIQSDDGNYIYCTLYQDVSSSERISNVRLDVHQYQENGKSSKVLTFYPGQSEGSLTPRQQDIARLILQGYSNQEIADKLHVSINTVRNHKRDLFRKTNVRSSGELIRSYVVSQ